MKIARLETGRLAWVVLHLLVYPKKNCSAQKEETLVGISNSWDSQSSFVSQSVGDGTILKAHEATLSEHSLVTALQLNLILHDWSKTTMAVDEFATLKKQVLYYNKVTMYTSSSSYVVRSNLANHPSSRVPKKKHNKAKTTKTLRSLVATTAKNKKLHNS